MINATDVNATETTTGVQDCPNWCTNGDRCRGEHWGEGRMVSASLYSGEGDGPVELYVAAVREDMTGGRPGVSLSIGQFGREGEDGMTAFLTVREMRELRDAVQGVLDQLHDGMPAN